MRRSADEFDCTTRFENAHRTVPRVVLYRQHPFGRRVCVRLPRELVSPHVSSPQGQRPCRRATSEILGPSSKLSATIRAFSSAVLCHDTSWLFRAYLENCLYCLLGSMGSSAAQIGGMETAILRKWPHFILWSSSWLRQPEHQPSSIVIPIVEAIYNRSAPT
jgi:hypothetical protein